MRKIATALIVLLAAIGGALFWLSGNIDGLAKDAIRHYSGAMTQARISVGAVKIAPVNGKGTISFDHMMKSAGDALGTAGTAVKGLFK